MRKWAFVSDFDGTISNQDYYWFVIENYFPKGRELYNKWKKQEMLDIEFLQTVFRSIHQNEEKIIEDILSIPIDTYVPTFIKQVQENYGDFYILSAGTDYYIYHILKKYNIKEVKVLSNKGFFHEKNVHLRIDPQHKHYSKRYGIDKSKIIKELKENYDYVYFIGDSEPDSYPATLADVTFAKDALQQILHKNNVPYIPVETFQEVEAYLKKKGVIN